MITAKANSTVDILGNKAAATAKKTIAFAEADAFLAKQRAYAVGYKGVADNLELSAESLMVTGCKVEASTEFEQFYSVACRLRCAPLIET